MTFNDFIRRASEKLPRLAWFTGAGFSQSANLPTAVDVMWDLKRRFYCSEENQTVAPNDLQNPAIREKITQFLLARAFPNPGDPGEYSRCFEIVFGTDYERQQRYLSAMLADGRASLTQGHRIFAALISSKLINCVFTTNFDNIVEKALAEVAGQSLSAFHLEGSYAAKQALNGDQFPVYVKLHGDFRYQSLKNLSSDLAAQNTELAGALQIAGGRFGLIVAGYSGRDESVMSLLQSVVAGHNPFPHGLYWLGLKGRSPLPAVGKLLDAAKAKGVSAEFVEIETFDALMARLWKQVPNRDPTLVAKVGRASQASVSIPLPDVGKALPYVRTNALPITLPSQCLTLTLATEPDAKALDRIEGASGGSVTAIKADGKIWAWGHDRSLQKTFGAGLLSTTASPLADRLADFQHNLFLKPFIERSIGVGFTRGKPLIHRRWRDRGILAVRNSFDGTGADALVAAVRTIHGSGSSIRGIVPGLKTTPTAEHPDAVDVYWAEALEFELEEVDQKFWILVRPQIWIWPSRARREAEDFLDERRGGRFNKHTDALLTAWIKLLLPSARRGEEHRIAPFGDAQSAGLPIFTIRDRTAFARRAVL
jgi:hypothetical protein